MRKFCLLACTIPFMTLGACQTTSFNDIPEMTDAEYSKVTNLPEFKSETEGSNTKTTFYSRVSFLKKRGKKLYGAWTDSTSSACKRDFSNAYILAKNEVSRTTKSDPCPEGTSGYGEDVIKMKTEDDSDSLIGLLIGAF